MEIWKDIEFNPRYQVSNIGRVRKRLVKRRPFNFIKIETMDNNYQRVTLSKGGISKRFLLHRLVAKYFNPNPENKPLVLHGDNNPSNNIATNLRWGTYSDNLLQAYQDKRTSKQGVKNSIAVFKNEDILKIRELKSHGFSQRHLGRLYGVCQAHISMIVNRKIWAHI